MALHDIQVTYSVVENEATVTKITRVGVISDTLEEAKSILQPVLTRFMTTVGGTLISVN